MLADSQIEAKTGFHLPLPLGTIKIKLCVPLLRTMENPSSENLHSNVHHFQAKVGSTIVWSANKVTFDVCVPVSYFIKVYTYFTQQ